MLELSLFIEFGGHLGALNTMAKSRDHEISRASEIHPKGGP